jgi:hypothetical protein
VLLDVNWACHSVSHSDVRHVSPTHHFEDFEDVFLFFSFLSSSMYWRGSTSTSMLPHLRPEKWGPHRIPAKDGVSYDSPIGNGLLETWSRVGAAAEAPCADSVLPASFGSPTSCRALNSLRPAGRSTVTIFLFVCSSFCLYHLGHNHSLQQWELVF